MYVPFFFFLHHIGSRKPAQCHPGPVSSSGSVGQLLLCEHLTQSTDGEAGGLCCTSNRVLSTSVSAHTQV